MMSAYEPGLTRTGRVWLLALLVLAVFAVTPQQAWGHNALVSSSPADGETVAKSPATVVLTFNEPAIATGTKVLVTGPDGSVTRGDPELVDTTVRQQVMADLPAGEYTVEWRVTSADGHPITGNLSFRVRSSASGEQSSTEPPSAPRSAIPATPPPSTPPATTVATPPTPAAAPSTAAETGPGAASGWLWLLALIPVGLAAVLGWRFSRHR